MRDITGIEDDVASVHGWLEAFGDLTECANAAVYRLAADVPELLAALEQARSIAVRLEQEVAANEPSF
jgi:hypothetical protein